MDHKHNIRRKKSAEASITTGIVFTIAFGIAWASTGIWPFIFPMFFAGVLPAVEGFRRLMKERSRGRNLSIDDEASGEKQVLQTARDEKGIITPALVALKTSLSISQAEKLLEGMAQRGYALMNINKNGRIEYEFPEFTPRLDNKAQG